MVRDASESYNLQCFIIVGWRRRVTMVTENWSTSARFSYLPSYFEFEDVEFFETSSTDGIRLDAGSAPIVLTGALGNWISA